MERVHYCHHRVELVPVFQDWVHEEGGDDRSWIGLRQCDVIESVSSKKVETTGPESAKGSVTP
jgi:hypothetical protein